MNTFIHLTINYRSDNHYQISRLLLVFSFFKSKPFSLIWINDRIDNFDNNFDIIYWLNCLDIFLPRLIYFRIIGRIVMGLTSTHYFSNKSFISIRTEKYHILILETNSFCWKCFISKSSNELFFSLSLSWFWSNSVLCSEDVHYQDRDILQ